MFSWTSIRGFVYIGGIFFSFILHLQRTIYEKKRLVYTYIYCIYIYAWYHCSVSWLTKDIKKVKTESAGLPHTWGIIVHAHYPQE